MMKKIKPFVINLLLIIRIIIIIIIMIQSHTCSAAFGSRSSITLPVSLSLVAKATAKGV